MSINENILVFAGNYNQYMDWINDNKADKRRYRYITLPEQLRGLHNIEYVTAGEYYLNKAWSAFKESRLRGIMVHKVE